MVMVAIEFCPLFSADAMLVLLDSIVTVLVGVKRVDVVALLSITIEALAVGRLTLELMGVWVVVVVVLATIVDDGKSLATDKVLLLLLEVANTIGSR